MMLSLNPHAPVEDTFLRLTHHLSFAVDWIETIPDINKSR
jgi:hypothetical protein